MFSVGSKLVLALLFVVLVVPVIWHSPDADAQRRKRPAAISKIKVKRVITGLSPQEASAATAYLQKNLSISTATANLCKSLKRLERAHAALQKYPGNKRLLLRFHTRVTSSQKLATSLAKLLDPKGSPLKSGSRKMAAKGAPLSGGAKTLLTLTHKVTKELGASNTISGPKGKDSLTDGDLGSLSSQQRITTRDRETLLGIIEPVIYR